METRWSGAGEASGRRRSVAASLLTVTGAAAVTLLFSGCGGGSGSPQVASLGSTSTPTSSSTTPAPSGGPSPSSGSGGARGGGNNVRMVMNVGNVTQGRKFSACMRAHGIANFPDPNGQGVIQIDSGDGIDPGSPGFQSAQSACRKLLPNGGQPTPQQQAQMRAALLKFAQCMRAHGIKDFPDPSNGGLVFHVNPASDLNPGNPQFQTAQQACRADLPGQVQQKFGAGPGAADGGKPGSGGGSG